MKIIKTVLIVIAVLIGIVLIVSVFLPSKYKVTRETIISASMEVVFNQVNDFNQMQNWSPWRDYDPGMTISVEGEIGKAGYKYSWASKNKEVGNGSLTRVSTETGKLITNELNFADYEMKSLNVWTFEQLPEGVKVVWGNEGDIPFLGRIFFMLMDPDKMMGPDFEKGLARLKSYCEKNDKPAGAAQIKIETVQVAEMNYLAIREKADTASIGQKLGECYGSIQQAMGKQGLEFAGAPFAIYYSESSTNFDFDAAIAVTKAGKADGSVKPGVLKATKAVVGHHYGSYDLTPQAHEAIYAFIVKNNLKIIGPVWEVYVTDPATVKNPSEILTDIYYGVE